MTTLSEQEKKEIKDEVFWNATQGRFGGFIFGMFLGGIFGAGFGLLAAFLPAILAGASIASVTLGTAALATGLGAAVGMGMGIVGFAQVGTTAGAVATAIIKQKEASPGSGKEPVAVEASQTVDVEESKRILPKGGLVTLFNWKVAGVGGLIGAAAGAVTAASGYFPAGDFILGGLTGIPAIASAGLMAGLFGAVFGLSKTPLKALKRYTDGLFYEGKLIGNVLATRAPETDKPLPEITKYMDTSTVQAARRTNGGPRRFESFEALIAHQANESTEPSLKR
jgi:hypothetical protein